jgi:hypothetical protein
MAESGKIEVGVKLNLEEARRNVRQLGDEARRELRKGSLATDPGRAMEGDITPSKTRAEAARRWGMGSPWLAQQGGAQPPPVPPTSVAGMAQQGLTTPLKTFGQMAVKATAALAGFRVAAGLIMYAFRLIYKPINDFVQFLTKAAEQGRALYARQLTSGGLPGGFVAYRSNLAAVLGVSEKEVFQYGAAIESVGKKVKWASDVQAHTAPVLAGAAHEFKALGLSINATAQLIAVEFVPALSKVSWVMRNIIQANAGWVLKGGKMALEGALKAKFGTIGVEIAELIGRFIPSANAPTPAVGARRLPISGWERMGLIMGSGPGTNYTRETSQNTRKLVELTHKLVAYVSPRGEFMRYKAAGNSP